MRSRLDGRGEHLKKGAGKGGDFELAKQGFRRSGEGGLG